MEKNKFSEKPDVIVAFSFADEDANKAIASRSKELSLKYRIPIFTQHDVAKYMPDRKEVLLAKQTHVHISTLAIICALEEQAKISGWKTAYLVAAPCHEWRCCRDLREIGFKFVKDGYFKEKGSKKISWYNKNDQLPWVRNPFAWWTREITLRLVPWPVYCKVANKS